MIKKIKIPTSLEEISIGKISKFVELTEADTSEKMKVIRSVSLITDQTFEEVSSWSTVSILEIYTKTVNMISDQSKTQAERLPFFFWEKIQYGFEPDLDTMEAGAFFDMDQLVADPIRNIAEIMAILYRPVKSSFGGRYGLKSYYDEPQFEYVQRVEIFRKHMPYSYVRMLTNFFFHLDYLCSRDSNGATVPK